MKINQNAPKPIHPLTKIIMQLLHWMSHLELSGGGSGEHEIGLMMPQSSFPNSMKVNKTIIN